MDCTLLQLLVRLSVLLSLMPHEHEHGDESMLRDQGFIRVKQAAELLGVSPNTVRAWGAAGKIPEYRHPINRYRLYKQEDLEAVLAELERSATTAVPRRR
jgi:excisionase family DNA binding protein